MRMACRQQSLVLPAARRAHSRLRAGGAGAGAAPACGQARRGARQLGPRVRALGGREEQQQNRGGLDPRLEVEVPADQRPVNELRQLKQAQLYSWATLDLPSYLKRLAILYTAVFLLLGGPIAAQTFDPTGHPLQWFLSASTGALLVVAVASLRIYLGWSYVGARLLTAALEYEETGWYDGQVFVKPPEVLTRDRLIGTYEVKPVLARLRTTLQLTGGALVATTAALVLLLASQPEAEDKVRDLSSLLDDDEAAKLEAEAQGSVPGYCADRYFKAAAGGEEVCQRLEGRW
eukprot:scaffold4.g4946.t1